MAIFHSYNVKTDYIKGKPRLRLIEFDCQRTNLYLGYFYILIMDEKVLVLCEK